MIFVGHGKLNCRLGKLGISADTVYRSCEEGDDVFKYVNSIQNLHIMQSTKSKKGRGKEVYTVKTESSVFYNIPQEKRD